MREIIFSDDKRCLVVTDEMQDVRYSSKWGDHLAFWAGQYATYGDGTVQHAPMNFIRMEDVQVYLLHLVKAMLAKPEIVAKVAESWPCRSLTRKQILWLAGLRQKEDKKVFYCLSDMKTSTLESKRHDRRWKVVPDTTGKPSDVVHMADVYCGTILERIHLYDYVTQDMQEDGGYWGSVDGMLNLPEGTHQAFRYVQSLVNAHREVNWVRRNCE